MTTLNGLIQTEGFPPTLFRLCDGSSLYPRRAKVGKSGSLLKSLHKNESRDIECVCIQV